MARHRFIPPLPDPRVVESALDALKAEELRGMIRTLLRWIHAGPRDQIVDALVECAARSEAGWRPEAPSAEEMRTTLAFARAALIDTYADPEQVDMHLRRGTRAFLAGDYHAASEIFGALLPPLAIADFHVGQDEMVDEVLNVWVPSCAAQYAVSIYMLSAPERRARAVCSALEEVHDLLSHRAPLEDLQRAAIEPLPEFERFLVEYRALKEGGPGRPP